MCKRRQDCRLKCELSKKFADGHVFNPPGRFAGVAPLRPDSKLATALLAATGTEVKAAPGAASEAAGTAEAPCFRLRGRLAVAANDFTEPPVAISAWVEALSAAPADTVVAPCGVGSTDAAVAAAAPVVVVRPRAPPDSSAAAAVASRASPPATAGPTAEPLTVAVVSWGATSGTGTAATAAAAVAAAVAAAPAAAALLLFE
jgi:hypothetical protein